MQTTRSKGDVWASTSTLVGEAAESGLWVTILRPPRPGEEVRLPADCPSSRYNSIVWSTGSPERAFWWRSTLGTSRPAGEPIHAQYSSPAVRGRGGRSSPSARMLTGPTRWAGFRPRGRPCSRGRILGDARPRGDLGRADRAYVRSSTLTPCPPTGRRRIRAPGGSRA